MKRTRSDSENSQLFTDMTFYMRPCSIRSNIRKLLEKHGGTFSKTSREESVVLTDSLAHTYGYHLDFIHDSIKENKLQDMSKYKLPLYNSKFVVNNHQIKVPLHLINKARQRYIPEEDEAICKYVTKFAAAGDQVGSIHGNVIWREMERKRVTLHTWQSMKDRYINHVQHCPPKFKYNVLDIDGGDVVSRKRKLIMHDNPESSKKFSQDNVLDAVMIVNSTKASQDKIPDAIKELNSSRLSKENGPHIMKEGSSARMSINVSDAIEQISSTKMLEDNISDTMEEVSSKRMSEDNVPYAIEQVNSTRMSEDNVSDAIELVNSTRMPEDNVQDVLEEVNLVRVSILEEVNLVRVSKDHVPNAVEEKICKQILEGELTDAIREINYVRMLDDTVPGSAMEEVDSKTMSEDSDPDIMKWFFSKRMSKNNGLKEVMSKRMLGNSVPDVIEEENSSRVSEDNVLDAIEGVVSKSVSEGAIPDAVNSTSVLDNVPDAAEEKIINKNLTKQFANEKEDVIFTENEKEDVIFTDSDDDDFDENLLKEAHKSTPIPCNFNTTCSSQSTLYRKEDGPVYCECYENIDYAEALKTREDIENILQDHIVWTSIRNRLIQRDIALRYGLSLNEVEQIFLTQQN